MKTLFKKPTTFIKYALTLIAFAIVLGTVFVIGFGFNTNSDFGGVYELTIDCFDDNKVSDYTDIATDVLDEYGYSAKDIIVEERAICDTIVIRYASKSASNAQKIENDLTAKLELNENLVSVNKLSLPSANRDALMILLAFGVSMAVMFVYLWIRMDWKKASTVALSYLISGILPVAICAISRIEISLVSLGVIFIMALVTAILTAIIFAKIESIEKYQDDETSFIDNFLALAGENKIKAIIPTALVLLVFVCLMFTFTRNLVFTGLVGIVSLVCFAFVAIIFAPNFYLVLNTKIIKKKNK